MSLWLMESDHKTGNWKTYKKNYCNTNDIYHPLRLNCLANTYMYRRTGWETLLGESIQKLPHTTIKTIELEISISEYLLQKLIICKFKKETSEAAAVR